MFKAYTIGFTEKSASDFFSLIKKNNVKKVIDTRINNSSQLSGFAKNKDLSFFLHELCSADYVWEPEMAPTKELLAAYRSKSITWDVYEKMYMDLIVGRKIEMKYSPDFLEDSCLLCSEHLPHHCHRKILVDYLNKEWGNKFKVIHLK